MKYRLIHTLAVLTASVLLGACDTSLPEDEQNPTYTYYSFGCTEKLPDTKSAYFADGTAVKNYCLFFYVEDKLKYSFHSPDGREIKVQIADSDRDSEMMVFALANAGNVISKFPVGSKTEQLLAYRQSFVSLSSLDGVPASYKPESPVIPSRDLEGKTTVLPAVPLMARFNIDLSVINAEYPGSLKVKNVSCFNTNSSVSAFGSRDRATSVVSSGDRLSTGSDIPAFMRGSSVSFFVPENMQGSISNPSKDYRLKKPSNNLCTYAVIEAEYSSDLAIYGLEYIIYLGEDLYTSFDIERNRSYDLHLTLDLGDSYLFGQVPSTPSRTNPVQGPYVNRLGEVRYRLAAWYEGEEVQTIGCNTMDELPLTFKAVGDLFRGDVLSVPAYRVKDLDWDSVNWDNEDEWRILQPDDQGQCLYVYRAGDDVCEVSSSFKGIRISGGFEVRATDGMVTVTAMESESDLKVQVMNHYCHRDISVDVEVEVTVTGRADKISALENMDRVPQYDSEKYNWRGNVVLGPGQSTFTPDMKGKISDMAAAITSKFIICDEDVNGDQLADYGGWRVFFRFHTVEIKVKATSKEAALKLKCESAFKEVKNTDYWTPMTVGVNTRYDDNISSHWSTLTPRF